jgi:outer membrane protein OmpA-like peptidoglycan-associated protein
MRGVVLGAAVMLASCGPSEPAGPDVGAGDSPPPSAVAPPAGAASTGANTLGAGQSLTGAVSGLTGQITAFRVQETQTQIIVELAADVLFAFDSADLSAQAPEQLRKTADQIARGGPGDIQIIGHTDSLGDDAYNQALSLRRAQAVADGLAAKGVDRARLTPEGRGKAEPIAPNLIDGRDNPEGRAQNRRVAVVIPKA